MRRDKLYKAQAAEVTRSRWWRVAWAELVRWQKRLSSTAKTLTGLAATAGALYAALQRPVRWGLRMFHARDVGRPEQPKGGSERMAVDRVEEPRK